LETINNDEKE